MPDDGNAQIHARGNLDLFDTDFNLLYRTEFGQQATYRPHLLWKPPYLFLSFDHGPVELQRFSVNLD